MRYRGDLKCPESPKSPKWDLLTILIRGPKVHEVHPPYKGGTMDTPNLGLGVVIDPNPANARVDINTGGNEPSVGQIGDDLGSPIFSFVR